MDLNNLGRQVSWLWKHRHTHTGDELDDIERRLIIVEERTDTGLPGIFNGARIHLRRPGTQAVADDTATAISWTSQSPIGRSGFVDQDLPTDEILVTQIGYYNIGVELAWETPFVEQWNVEVFRVRDGVEVQVYPDANSPDGVWGGTHARAIREIAEAVPFEPGDKMKVYVRQQSGESQNLQNATLAFYKVDQTGAEGPSAPSVLDVASTKIGPVSVSDGVPLVWALPTYVPDDLVFILVDGADATKSWATPSGWTLLKSITASESRAYLFSKVMTGSEGSTITLTPSAAVTAAGIAWRVRSGVDYSTFPPDVANFAESFTAPSVTPSHGAAEYVVFVGVGGANRYGISGPSTFDVVANVEVVNAPGDDPICYVSMKEFSTDTTVAPGTVAQTSDAGSGRNLMTTSIMVKVGDL